MPDDSLSKRLALINTLLRPIQRTIRVLLPDFIDRNLKSKTVRAAIVTAADAALVRQFPIARIFPPETRQRLIRSQLDLVLDELVLKDSLPTDDLGTSFRSFIVTAKSAVATPADVVEAAMLKLLGADWTATPLPIDAFTFELTTEHPQLSVREAWELAYRLQQEPGIAHAEPNLIVPLENVAPDEGPASGAKSFFGRKPLPGSAPPEWSLDNIHVKEAWAQADNDHQPSRGEGILIGHPDTGYTQHIENGRIIRQNGVCCRNSVGISGRTTLMRPTISTRHWVRSSARVSLEIPDTAPAHPALFLATKVRAAEHNTSPAWRHALV
jgi:hypothetical protein